jgi:Flp pilus assembly protein TadD
MKKCPNDKLSYLLIIFLVVITIGAFSQVVKHPFVSYDDDKYVYENPFIQSGLTGQGIVWAFSATYAANWHPITWLSHMLDIQLFGLRAGGHHFVNMLFHTANTLLLFLLLWRITGMLWQSCFVALLFAIHPLHVESVAWIAERKDVLSGFFFMLTLLAYVRYAEKPKLQRYTSMVIFFMLGLMSKPMLVTVPFLLLLLDYWPLARLKWSVLRPNVPPQETHLTPASRLLLEKLPLFILSGASCVITYFAQAKEGTVVSLAGFPFELRSANALVTVMRYLGKMIWPNSLSVYYPYDITSLSYWRVLGAAALIVCLTILALRTIKRRPYVTMGWLWYLGTLVPVIGLVQVGEQAMADRYTYLPLIGIFIAIVWGFHDLKSGWRFKRYLVIPFLAILFSSFFFATWFQVKYWRNGVALFSHSVKVTKNNGLANNNLGKALLDEGKFEEAIPFFRETLRIIPDLYASYSNLGIALGRVGKINEAIAYCRKALQINPNDAGAYFGLGYAFIQQGRIGEAVFAYRRAFQISPASRFSLTNLGVDLAQEGKMREAISIFWEAIRMNPKDAYAYYNLGYVLIFQGRIEEAMPYVKEAMRLNPNDQEMMENLNALMMRQK